MGRMTLDSRLLQYFHKTAELGNITLAAEALNLAQPTLSKAIKQLEYQLQVQLFTRSASGVRLTTEGARLLQHARLVSAQLADAVEDIEALRLGAAGTVCIGAGPSWVRRVLPEVIAQVLTDRPGLQVTVSSGFDDRMMEGLDTGALDFVVAEKPYAEAGTAYEFVELSEDELVVCARASHPLAGRPRVPAATALAMDWVLPQQDALSRSKLDARVAEIGLTRPAPILVSSSLTFTLQFIRAHDALIYTTRSILRTAESGGLTEIDVPELVSKRAAGLIFREASLLSPAALAVADALKEAARRSGPN